MKGPAETFDPYVADIMRPKAGRAVDAPLASLPISFGGSGLRKVSHIIVPAFLGSSALIASVLSSLNVSDGDVALPDTVGRVIEEQDEYMHVRH